MTPYQPLLEAGLLRRFYLDELPQLVDAPLGMSILQLIQQSESQAPMTARDLVSRTRREVGDEGLREDLLELIETVIIYKLPRLSREEIQTMLQIHDIRQSRVYQDALQEGINKGREEGIEKGREEGVKKGMEEGIRIAVLRMAEEQMTAEKIATILKMNVDLVRTVLATADKT